MSHSIESDDAAVPLSEGSLKEFWSPTMRKMYHFTTFLMWAAAVLFVVTLILILADFNFVTYHAWVVTPMLASLFGVVFMTMASGKRAAKDRAAQAAKEAAEK